ncbi:hypothetical protein OJF2_77610 [Aquisphaera giovannonii]|uniref:DUF1559 domain-containing protein n=1 Tax=Aquisphaera giovannonii TaxID=406548 RepID=A0A5B9WFU7_9BACT|nr:DUF1559 domain-containing protein [Aquisphaera giovannonii]QEH39149.1 hypothetical protein OJF2_77610 [Aquisphaera giovannonii]
MTRGIRTEAGRRGAGFTLIELLVVIAIIAVLIALLLPAVQAAREAARRIQCTNNIKQMLLGFHNHHNNYNGFPPVRTETPNYGWCVNLIPFLEQAVLFNAFNLNKNFYDYENQTVSHTSLSVFSCPSDPQGLRDVEIQLGKTDYGTKGTVGDYKTNHLLNAMYQVNGAAGNPVLLRAGQYQKISAITDGTSQTTLIHEQAGRPIWYLKGWKAQPTTAGLTNVYWWDCWASYSHFQYQGYSADGASTGWACGVNCSNAQGIYGFHPGGANVGFCDGSVRFLKDTTPALIVFKLATRDGGEPLSADQY